MLRPPPNAELTELPTATIWYDKEGFICAISKKGPERTPEIIRETLGIFKKMVGEKKICLMIDVTNISEITREGREVVAKEFPGFIKAIALVSGSALGKMIANLFFTLKTQPYPTKMFNDETKAREWLKQHCS